VICIPSKVYLFNIYHGLILYKFLILLFVISILLQFTRCIGWLQRRVSFHTTYAVYHNMQHTIRHYMLVMLFKSIRYYTWCIFSIVVSPVGLIHIVIENTRTPVTPVDYNNNIVIYIDRYSENCTSLVLHFSLFIHQ